MRLDTSGLQAQLAQAQAAVDAAQATLQGLQAGQRRHRRCKFPQAALATAQQSLTNTYTSMPNAVTDAYAKANDAVHNQIGTFLITIPTLTILSFRFQVNDSASDERCEYRTGSGGQ